MTLQVPEGPCEPLEEHRRHVMRAREQIEAVRGQRDLALEHLAEIGGRVIGVLGACLEDVRRFYDRLTFDRRQG